MPKRSLSDPQSMAGATAEEVLALKPPGWLVRPLPAGRLPRPLDTKELVAVHGERAETAVADPQNWWRDDNDASAEPATQVFALSITGKGATTLASFAGPQPASRSRRKHRH